MSTASPTLHRFLLRAVLWLPVCFALWYLSANFWLAPVRALLDHLLQARLPNVVDSLAGQGHVFELLTRLRPANAPHADALLSFELNPLIYAYCLPLYAGLTLATPSASRLRMMRNLLVGLVLLLPVVAWGTGFEILKTLAFTLAAETGAYLDFSGLRREMVAWGYQFGYLVLPGVTPLAIWIGFNRDFLASLAPGWQAPADEPPTAGS